MLDFFGTKLSKECGVVTITSDGQTSRRKFIEGILTKINLKTVEIKCRDGKKVLRRGTDCIRVTF